MTTAVSATGNAENVDKRATISGIREALGITLHPSTNPLANERELRMLGVLERLTGEQLSAVLTVSTKARHLSVLEPSTLNRLGHSDEANRLFTGDDCFSIRDLLFKGDLKNIYRLAAVVESMPVTMTIRAALLVITAVSNELFDLTNAERLAAHLRIGNSLPAKQRYSPQLMLLTHVHPDKTDTIIHLMSHGHLLPTHRDIVTRHLAAQVPAP